MAKEIIRNENNAFEVVDTFPVGYKVWNIGAHNMPAGYLPLCKPKWSQSLGGFYKVEADSLKAMRTDYAAEILNAVGCGAGTVAEMQDFLKKHAKAKEGTYAARCCNRIITALPYLQELEARR